MTEDVPAEEGPATFLAGMGAAVEIGVGADPRSRVGGTISRRRKGDADRGGLTESSKMSRALP